MTALSLWIILMLVPRLKVLEKAKLCLKGLEERSRSEEKRVSQADIDRFAKLGVVQFQHSMLSTSLTIQKQIQEKVEPLFKDKCTFLSKINELPSALGTEWKCEEFELVGNVLDKDGTPMVQTIELWKHDPVACIKELMQDPQFAKHMCYAPEKMYTDEGMKHQAFDEMATGKW
ncbi:hypothetical protein ARMGADRAFT_1032586 [Armillaria gallica]|uniref:Uncharacterized protein n=1 Tax=Armillaria gallica TaxID=47427 RepID=A0A2H3D924_ARMGA|nr:hypothetical protein ARMGADRAFT_1032586 [Armillaria gallica]